MEGDMTEIMTSHLLHNTSQEETIQRLVFMSMA